VIVNENHTESLLEFMRHSPYNFIKVSANTYYCDNDFQLLNQLQKYKDPNNKRVTNTAVNDENYSPQYHPECPPDLYVYGDIYIGFVFSSLGEYLKNLKVRDLERLNIPWEKVAQMIHDMP
jgi:hypothetical protein